MRSTRVRSYLVAIFILMCLSLEFCVESLLHGKAASRLHLYSFCFHKYLNVGEMLEPEERARGLKRICNVEKDEPQVSIYDDATIYYAICMALFALAQ